MRPARLVLVAIALGAFGCSGGSSVPRLPTPLSPTPPVAGPDLAASACYLVSDSEVGAIVGRQLMAPGSGFELGGASYCNWAINMSPLEAAGITVSRGAEHEAGRFDPWEPVAGLGDDAYYLPGLLLSVKKGDQRLTVVVTSETVDPKAASIQIAQKALPRL